MKPAASAGGREYRPRHLGRRSRKPCAEIDRIPWRGGGVVVELVCDEFTSLCPVTGQPDFGVLTIRYEPRGWLAESKSLKLYLWQFRERGIFSEELVAVIADDLLRQLRPAWIEVCGRFKSRGGIAIGVTARREEAEGPRGK